MKLKKSLGLGLSLIMTISSFNASFAQNDSINDKIITFSKDDIVSSQAIETEDKNLKVENINLAETELPYAVEGGNIYYNPSTGEITYADETVVSVNIPETIDGVKITSLADEAFWACEDLTDVTIPSGVTSIGEKAFWECYSLTNISVDEKNQFYKSIDGILYNKSGTEILVYPKGLEDETIEIPPEITKIGSWAFSSCINFTNIIIPNSVKEIGEYAFHNCISLTSVTIPNSVATIEEGVFSNCMDLTSVTIPYGVTMLGDDAFSDCMNLPRVVIPNSVTYIGNNSFAYCESLVSITIPNNVTNIDEYAFHYSDNVTIYCYRDSYAQEYAVNNNISYEIIDAGETINVSGVILDKDNAVIGVGDTINLIAVILPENATNKNILWESSNEKIALVDQSGVVKGISAGNAVIKVTTEDGGFNAECAVTVKGEEAYAVEGGNIYYNTATGIITKCDSSITSAVIPSEINGVKIVGIAEYAFEKCKQLTSLTLSDAMIHIEPGEFFGCDKLTRIDVDEKNTVFSSINGVLFNKTKTEIVTYPKGLENKVYVIPDGVTSIGNDAFYECKNLSSVIIPNGVTNIGLGAFYECSKLTEVIIPDSVTNIEDMAFYACASLINITIPNSVKNIGEWAFAWGSLTSVKLPEGLTTIKENTFYKNNDLTEVIIPDSVTSIKEYAFGYCDNLKSITISRNVTEIGREILEECDAVIYCYKNSFAETYAKSNVIPYKIIYEEGNDVNRYAVEGGYIYYDPDAGMITNCDKSVTSVTIPNVIDGIEIKGINDYAFYDCGNLKSVKLSDKISKISNWAFAYCGSLEDIEIPDKITSIGSYAFYNCESLKSIKIPNSVAYIEEAAFKGCTGLKNIEIPEKVTSIQHEVFAFCSSLTSIKALGEIRTIPNNNAFQGCKSLTYISINENNMNSAIFSIDGVLFGRTKTDIRLEVYPTGSNNENYVVPEGVTYIYWHSFNECKALKSIEIPKEVTRISEDAFVNCENLTIKCYKGSTAETFAKDNSIPYILIDGDNDESTESSSSSSEASSESSSSEESSESESSSEEYIPTPMKGDVNGDTKITANDASLVLQYVLNKKDTAGFIKGGFYAADVTRDGRVTALDAATILRKALNDKFVMPVEVTAK